jgi:hypothetical protein
MKGINVKESILMGQKSRKVKLVGIAMYHNANMDATNSSENILDGRSKICNFVVQVVWYQW